jgi:NAD(P)H-flavin reductase
MLTYKVVEIPIVTDETIEAVLNEWTAQGWQFDSLQFVVRDASKRPSMAFVLFIRSERPPA